MSSPNSKPELRCMLLPEFAPLTFSVGFLERPLDEVKDSFAKWHRLILRKTTSESLEGTLENMLSRLDPLDQEGTRALLVATRSGWTAYFDNAVRGSEPETTVGVLTKQLKCRGLTVTSIPNTLEGADKAVHSGTWGCCKMEIYGPSDTEFLNVERTITVSKDVGGWSFFERGPQQSFEDIERNKRRRLVDRFNTSVLVDYCKAMGLHVADSEFYSGPAILITSRSWIFSPKEAVSLKRAREALGLPA